MIQRGMRIELSFSVNIQLKTPSGTLGGIKTQTWLAKNNTASIVNTEAALYVLGKRKTKANRRKKNSTSKTKQNNILEKICKSFIGL